MGPSEPMELSEAQRLAVETVGKNVCVSAGAGSGKTGVLVERFLNLVMRHGISPAAVLALTFTEKAANEMKRRIVKRLTENGLDAARREVENAHIGTLHAFAARLLREHPLEAGIDPNFVILKEEEAALLKQRALDQVIEAGVTEAEVFHLLGLYSEESVREGILSVFESSRNSKMAFEELLRKRVPSDRSFFESSLRSALGKISGVTGTDEVALGLREIAAKEKLGLEEAAFLEGLKKELRASGKQSEAIRGVQRLLLEYAALAREESSLPLREIFIRLALAFEKTYEAEKRAERALDFDDLQIKAVRLLGSGEPASRGLGRIYREKFREILVDEFQDTNRLQDRLIELVRRESNLFVVGDVKQSIYGFRGTEVEIFLEKEKAFHENPSGLRVPLVKNYRAVPRLIDFVNRFARALWAEDGFSFEALEPHRPEVRQGAAVEWLSLKQAKEESLDEARIREARTLARRIALLVKEEGFQYKEIACLFRAMSDTHFYEHEFRRAGIPYFVVSSRGFYAQPEIRDLLAFLSALENPRQDIPLAAALRSPLFQVSDETLFWLARRAKPGKKSAVPLMEGVRVFEEIPQIPAVQKEKLRFFRENFEAFLAEKEKLRISELVERLLRVTAYDLYVLKLRQGGRRYANLRKLVELAREAESKEAVPLGDFVRMIEGLEKVEVRESQAEVEAEEGNVVKLLSIHRAKGLEFPVVVLPDLGRGRDPEKGDFFLSEAEGLGIRSRGRPNEKPAPTLTFMRIRETLKRADSGESKRLFYVGMTRAKEKLILSGAVKEKELKESFHEMTSWAEWTEKVLRQGEWDVKKLEEVPREAFPYERRRSLAERKSIRERLEALQPVRLRKTPEGLGPILENLAPPTRTDYERIDLPVSAFLLFAKDPKAYFNVYEIGAPATVETKPEEPRLEEDGLAPADFGTRVHRVLEQVLIRRPAWPQTEKMISRMNQDLAERDREEITGLVRRFLESQEGKEALASRKSYPELPFVLRLSHGLVHGVLDLLYQNGKGEWVIADYKTSAVDSEGAARRGEEYRVQLELYALAVSQILGLPPVEARILFLRPGLSHSIPFNASEMGRLQEKFTTLQKAVLTFRRNL